MTPELLYDLGRMLRAAKRQKDAVAYLRYSTNWPKLNRRRAELIHKKNRGGLDDLEDLEFRLLQHCSGMVIETAHPEPELLASELTETLKAKGLTDG